VSENQTPGGRKVGPRCTDSGFRTSRAPVAHGTRPPLPPAPSRGRAPCTQYPQHLYPRSERASDNGSRCYPARCLELCSWTHPNLLRRQNRWEPTERYSRWLISFLCFRLYAKLCTGLPPTLSFVSRNVQRGCNMLRVIAGRACHFCSVGAMREHLRLTARRFSIER
jgi:hypothetical protein